MKSVYKSVIDRKAMYASIVVFVFLLVITCFGPWPMVFIPLVGLAIVLPMYLNTSYTIDGDVLRIRCGLFTRKNFPIAGIHEIRKLESIARNSPSLSARDCISIFYTTYDSVAMSPERRVEFIAQLQAINPDIKVDDKCLQ